MVAVSAAEVFGLITVIRVIAPPRVTAASNPSMPGAPTAMRAAGAPARAAAYASPLRRCSAANAPQNASPAPVLSTGSMTSAGTAVGSGRSPGRHQASGRGELDHHRMWPQLQEGRGGRVQIGRPGQRGGLDLAGQEDITGAYRIAQSGLVSGDVVLLRIEVDRRRGAVAQPRRELELCVQRHRRHQDPGRGQRGVGHVGGVHRKGLEVRLAQQQLPHPPAGVVVAHDVAHGGQVASRQRRGIRPRRADRVEQSRGRVGTQRGEDPGIAAGQPGGQRGEKRVPADGFDCAARRGTRPRRW